MKWRVHQWARTPFPLVPHGGGSVLAVKGSLRALDCSGPIRELCSEVVYGGCLRSGVS